MKLKSKAIWRIRLVQFVVANLCAVVLFLACAIGNDSNIEIINTRPPIERRIAIEVCRNQNSSNDEDHLCDIGYLDSEYKQFIPLQRDVPMSWPGYFSWSPNGNYLAHYDDHHLLSVFRPDGQVKMLESGKYPSSSKAKSMGLVWELEHNMLLVSRWYGPNLTPTVCVTTYDINSGSNCQVCRGGSYGWAFIEPCELSSTKYGNVIINLVPKSYVLTINSCDSEGNCFPIYEREPPHGEGFSHPETDNFQFLIKEGKLQVTDRRSNQMSLYDFPNGEIRRASPSPLWNGVE